MISYEMQCDNKKLQIFISSKIVVEMTESEKIVFTTAMQTYNRKMTKYARLN